MPHRLSYQEQRPPADLMGWIACFWWITGSVEGAAPVLHRVLPDGCADLLFNLAAHRSGRGVAAELVGPMSAAQVFELGGSVDLLGVRMRPGAVAAFGRVRDQWDAARRLVQRERYAQHLQQLPAGWLG